MEDEAHDEHNKTMHEENAAGKDAAAASTNADAWYYIHNGARSGPVAGATIRWFVEQGKLSADDRVWRQTMKDWVAIRDTELHDGAMPPVLPGDTVDNSVVWLLAFVPLIYAVAQLELHHMLPWSGVAIANCALCLWDERQLTRAGHNTNRWMTAAAVLLVPAYLFVRASRLRQRPWYAITWVVVFVVCLAVK